MSRSLGIGTRDEAGEPSLGRCATVTTTGADTAGSDARAAGGMGRNAGRGGGTVVSATALGCTSTTLLLATSVRETAISGAPGSPSGSMYVATAKPLRMRTTPVALLMGAPARHNKHRRPKSHCPGREAHAEISAGSP